MFVCVGVVRLPAGNTVPAKRNERVSADYEVMGLASNRKLAKPFSSMNFLCIFKSGNYVFNVLYVNGLWVY